MLSFLFYDIFVTLKLDTKTVAFAAFIIMVGLRSHGLATVLKYYTERVNQMERIITAADKKGGNKFIANSKNFEKSYSKINWSYPVETLLLSAERGKEMCRSVISDKDTEDVKTNSMFKDSSIFVLRRWIIIHDGDLNQKYFYIQNGIYTTLDFKE